MDKQRIYEYLSTAVLVFDKDYKLVAMNPAGEMLLGISHRQAKNLPLDSLFAQAEIPLAIRHSVSSGQSLLQRSVELRLPGQSRSLQVDIVSSHVDEADAHMILEMVLVDIKGNRSENLLDQFDATHEVLRGLAHEVKNPLGGLRGAAQLLEKELHTDELKEYTRIIIDESDRLQKLLDRILLPHDLPNKKLCNIHQALEYVFSLSKAEDSPVQIKRDYDPSIPDFQADQDQLIQALLNLVRNAKQAITGEGRIILRTRTQRQYTIGSKRHRLVARIDVEDNGAGIPPDLEEKIFYPMVTGRAQGTGLGLSIAHSLIKFHGGSLECTSQPGKTVFSIYLPLENGNGD